MTKGELKAYFFGVFARPDLTPEQQEFYIQGALIRIGRLLRTPAMEGLIPLTISADNTIELPNNFLDHIDLYQSGKQSVISKTPAQFRALGFTTGDTAYFYTRVGDRYHLYPTLPAGTILNLYYYASPQPLLVEGDSNSLTNTAFDVIVYAACVDAATFFVDGERLEAFETLYRNRIEEIDIQSNMMKSVGGSPTVGIGTSQEV